MRLETRDLGRLKLCVMLSHARSLVNWSTWLLFRMYALGLSDTGIFALIPSTLIKKSVTRYRALTTIISLYRKQKFRASVFHQKADSWDIPLSFAAVSPVTPLNLHQPVILKKQKFDRNSWQHFHDSTQGYPLSASVACGTDITTHAYTSTYSVSVPVRCRTPLMHILQC